MQRAATERTSLQFKTHCLSRLRLSLLDVLPTCLRDDGCVRRPVFARCRRAPTCLCDAMRLQPTCLKGSVFAHPRVIATTWVFTRPVFEKCLCMGMCLRAAACRRPTCLRDVSSCAHAPLRRRVSSPDLSSGSVFGRLRVFATTRAFARRVYGDCLLARTWPHSCECLGKGLRSDAHVSSLQEVSLPGTCLQTPTCLRCLRLACVCRRLELSSQTACFEASFLDPTRFQAVSSVFGKYMRIPAPATAM